MPNNPSHIDIALLGKEYRVACPPEERDALLAAVAFVDEKMHDIAEKTGSTISERIAVMAALNIAHEYLSQSPPSGEAGQYPALETGVDIGDVKRRISGMEARLDAVLAPQDSLI